jgi:hypothetical protein
MTYHAPELVLIGAAQNLVLTNFGREVPDNTIGLHFSRDTPML